MSEDVTNWLEELGLGRYATLFAESDVDWDLLPELDHETLIHIGVSSPGHRLRIIKSAKSILKTPSEGSPFEEPSTTADPPPAHGEPIAVSSL